MKTAKEIRDAETKLTELEFIRSTLNSMHAYNFNITWDRGSKVPDPMPDQKHFPTLVRDWLRAHYEEKRERLVAELHDAGVQA